MMKLDEKALESAWQILPGGSLSKTGLDRAITAYLSAAPSAPQAMPEGLAKLFAEHPLRWSRGLDGSVNDANGNPLALAGSDASGGLNIILSLLNAAAPAKPFEPGWYWCSHPSYAPTPEPRRISYPQSHNDYLAMGWTIGPRIDPPKE